MARQPGKRKQLAVAHGAALDWVARNPRSQAALNNLDYIDSRLRKTGGALTGKEQDWSRQHGKYRPTLDLSASQRANLAKGKGPLKAEQPKYTRPGGPDDLSWGWRQVEQVGSLVPATIKLARMAVGGTIADIGKGEGIPGTLSWALSGGKAGKHPSLKSLGRGETTALGEEMGKGLIQSTKDLGDPQKWREDTVMQLMNAAGFVLAPVRAASAARLAKSIAIANPELSAARAIRLGVKESFNPGFAVAQGLKGGIKPRVIEGKYATAPGRMTSGSPVGRGGQRAVDAISEAIDRANPGGIGSSSARAAARNRRLAADAERRRKAINLAHEQTIAHAISPTKRDAAKRFAGIAAKVDPSVASALIASLEGPVGASVREAVQLKIAGMRSVLDQNLPNTEISAHIDDLKRSREKALAEDPDFDANPINRQIAEQQAQLDFKLGKSVPPVTGSPIREAVLKQMQATIGKQKAAETIKVWDAAARGANPRNPGQWYLENIADVKRMPHEAFAPQGEVLYQRMAGGQRAHGYHGPGLGWYFPSERMLTEMVEAGDRPRQAGQLFAELKKSLSAEEIRNSGLGVGVDSREMIRPSQVLDALNEEAYFERFDPDVTVTRYDPANPAISTRYHLDALNSRDIDADTEYYEMTVRFPELPGTRTGEQHWEQTGNTYHVRFQVFTDEDGMRVLLVDEIQSDWASDYRRAGKEGTQQRSPEETEAEHAALKKNYDEALGRFGDLSEERVSAYAEWQQRWADGPPSPNRPNEIDEYHAGRNRITDLDFRRSEAQDTVWRHGDELSDFEKWVDRRVPPSPMGPNRYAQNAIRQVLRHADSDDVDYVVLVDGHVQALRNQAVELGAEQGVTTQAGRVESYGRTRLQYGEWIDDETVQPLPNERITELLREQGTAGSFTRLYNEEFPKVFEIVAGAERRYLDDAYTGRHSAQPEQYDYEGYEGYVQPEDGSMPGTVFEMTPEVKAKIRQDQPLYRRNFEGVPQGATEFLADGRARLTMFQKADVSTWIHELAHIAVRDLDPGDLAILEKEIADGRSYGDWTEADQEKLARSFETYMRDGYAAPALREVFAKITKWMHDLWRKTGDEAEQITPETADVFDRMLGRRHQNTVVLDQAEVNQVQSLVRDLEKALDSGKVDELEDAATALAKLSEDAEAAGVEILMRNARTPEHAAAILEGLRQRKNIVVEDYRRRGLLDHAEEARGYFPQMSMWEALGRPQVEASRIGAVGDVIGTPRVTSKVINKNRNKLVRHQLGEVLNDPYAVTYVLHARLRVLETIRARNELYSVGTPVRAGEPLPDPQKFSFIRNPDVAPSQIDKATEAAATLSRADFKKLQAKRLAEDTEEINGAAAIEKETIWRGEGERPSWVTEEPNVRYVPKRVASKRLGEVFSSGAPKGPLAPIGATFGMLNAATRAALIYAPLGGARYVARNWIQNAVLMAVTQPSAFLKLMDVRWARKMEKEHPQTLDWIDNEVGTVQATALPEFNTRAQGKLQRGERYVNEISGSIGGHLGKLADVPLRRAAWRRHAERYGFRTPEDYQRLRDSPDLDNVREMIAQRTREDMIDFDAASPWEKEVLTRYLFIWPFIRGSVKWPFMYAREHPGRVWAASMATSQIRQEEGHDELLKAGDYSLGWLDPTLSAYQKAEALHETVVRGSRGEIKGLASPLLTEALAPQYQETVEMMGDTGGGGWSDLWTRVAPEFTPGLSTGQALHKNGVVAGTIEMAQKTFGKQTRPASVTKKADKWISDLDSTLKEMEKQGYQMPAPMKAEVERMRAAYGDWMEVSSRAKWDKQKEGVDSVDAIDRTLLAAQVMHEHYPVKYAQMTAAAKAGGWESMEEVVMSGKADNDKIYRTIYDQMFGMKEDFMRDAKKAGWGE